MNVTTKFLLLVLSAFGFILGSSALADELWTTWYTSEPLSNEPIYHYQESLFYNNTFKSRYRIAIESQGKIVNYFIITDRKVLEENSYDEGIVHHSFKKEFLTTLNNNYGNTKFFILTEAIESHGKTGKATLTLQDTSTDKVIYFYSHWYVEWNIIMSE